MKENQRGTLDVDLQLRSTRLRLFAGATFALSIVLAGCAGLNVKPGSGANLSGEWKLNESLSEDLSAQVAERRDTHPGGGMGRRGGRVHGERRGAPGGSEVPGRRAGSAARAGGSGQGSNREYLTQPMQLSIEQSARELKLTADGSSTLFVYGEEVIASLGSGTAERRSGWKDDVFIVVQSVKEGPTVTCSYVTADGGKQLLVTTKITGGRAPDREFQSVYDLLNAH